MKKKKVILRILAGFLAVVLLAAVGAYVLFAERIQAAMSVKKLDDSLYCMEFKGNYGFDEYLAKGGAPSDSQMADYIVEFLSNGFYKRDNSGVDERNFGCSTFKAVNDEGAVLYGRNYDWEPCDTMIVHTMPKNGYESVATCCMNFLGFGEGWLPEGFGNQFIAIASIYVPLDGMNEKGVVMADLMAGDRIATHQDTEKPDITTTAAIRMVLDHAANVDEALELLPQYDMNSAIESAHHYYLADSSGRAVVVEYIDNQMVVTETDILTNHYLAKQKYGIGSQNSHDRFDLLTQDQKATKGRMSMDELAQEMKKVSCGQLPDPEDLTEKTDWTCCYDTKEGIVDFYYLEDYEHHYTLKLGHGSSWIEKTE